MAKYVEFSVDGSGRFPVDMLRYDGAYPASSSDAAEMARRIEGPVKMADTKPIRLRAAIPSSMRKDANQSQMAVVPLGRGGREVLLGERHEQTEKQSSQD